MKSRCRLCVNVKKAQVQYAEIPPVWDENESRGTTQMNRTPLYRTPLKHQYAFCCNGLPVRSLLAVKSGFGSAAPGCSSAFRHRRTCTCCGSLRMRYEKLNLPFIAFNLIYSISKQEMLSNVFCIAAHKNWQAFFCKNGLIGRRGAASPQGTERACAVREGRLAFLRRCEKIYKSASRAFENGDRRDEKPGNNAARGIVYEMELRGMGLERYPF